MYERLTAYIPAMEGSDFGRWVTHGDGTPENRNASPFVLYERNVRKLAEAICDFADDHKAERVGDYGTILEENGITWGMASMKKADAAALDGRTVFALLLGAVRAERCCEGALLEFCESGCIRRWLMRLKETDEEKGSPGTGKSDCA